MTLGKGLGTPLISRLNESTEKYARENGYILVDVRGINGMDQIDPHPTNAQAQAIADLIYTKTTDLTIQIETDGHGEVAGPVKAAMGVEGIYEVTPQTGYELKSVLVNGETPYTVVAGDTSFEIKNINTDTHVKVEFLKTDEGKQSDQKKEDKKTNQTETVNTGSEKGDHPLLDFLISVFKKVKSRVFGFRETEK